MMSPASIYLIVVLITSLWAFLAYWIDKRRAQNGGYRVSEKSLHLIALVGGWPGALAAQRVFRHKTQKLAFLLVFWGVVVAHVGLVGSAAYWMWGR